MKNLFNKIIINANIALLTPGTKKSIPAGARGCQGKARLPPPSSRERGGGSLAPPPVFYFRVTKFEDIANKIIPFFFLNIIHLIKFLYYLDWCQVANMMKTKGPSYRRRISFIATCGYRGGGNLPGSEWSPAGKDFSYKNPMNKGRNYYGA